MNPILNKKDFDDLSTNLRDLAHNYIEKYKIRLYTSICLPLCNNKI